MGKLNSAIKRIENKGKKSVDPKKNQMAEVAPVVAAAAKGAAVVGKAVAKGAATAVKAGAKGAKVAAKTGAKATKKASSTASRMANAYDKMKKPASRNVVRRNVKNPRYKKLEKDDKGNIVRGKEFDKKLYDQDGNKKTQGYMSTIDGPEKSPSVDRELRQKKKEDDAKDKKVADTAQRLKKGTKKAVQKTGEYAKKSVSATTSNFGASSFAKEGITFKEYLNKL
tara:strand:- start:30 stop:704 length:675 start_codon:yes stop_codon:yes gene_type:complete